MKDAEKILNRDDCIKALKERCNQLGNTISGRELLKSQRDTLDLIYKILEVMER